MPCMERAVFFTMKKRIYKALLSTGAIYISFNKINFPPTNVAVYRLAFPTQKNLVNPANSVTKAEAPRIRCSAIEEVLLFSAIACGFVW